jgi:surfactin synthase thioesterase subunit
MTARNALGIGRWFQPTEPHPEAPIRLFLFPYAGGNVVMYRGWYELFPADITVQAVQLPGRLDRLGETGYTELDPLLEAMCEAFAVELDGRPYALFGHSMGALLAYRVAVTMEREYGLAPVLLGAAGWSPRGFLLPTMEQVNMPQDKMVEWIVSLGSLPPALHQDPEIIALTIPPARADLTICANYVDDGARVCCPVVTYTGRSDPMMSRKSAAAWAEYCSNYLGNCEFPGGHFFIYDEPLAIATDLTRHLRRCVASAGSRAL